MWPATNPYRTSEAHRTDPLQKIKKLSTTLPTRIQMPSDVAQPLGETKEWSSEWFTSHMM